MSRHDRATPVAQATWRSGAVHVWGWDGHDVASAAWLFGGFGRNVGTGADNGFRDAPTRYGDVRRIEVELAPDHVVMAPAVRLDAPAAVAWLADAPTPELSDSLAWFARMCSLAMAVIGAARLTPVVVDHGGGTVARWRTVRDPRLDAVLGRFDAAAPPITRAGGRSASSRQVLDALVDGCVRTSLFHAGWRPEVGRRRAPEIRAARTVFTALAGGDPTVRTTDPDHELAVATLRAELDRHERRCAGEPVVRPRLRLVPPEDPADAWLVGLELADDADAAHWCTASAARTRAPGPLELAGSADHLDLLVGVADEAVAAVTEVLGVLEPLAHPDRPDTVELGVEEVQDFLDVAPHELARLDIGLIGPEHLVRAPVSVRGRATPSPPDDRNRRFSKDALVEWNATVDGAALTDADLQRLTLAGSTLLHTGHRWVRIEPAGLRRARQLLEDQRASRPTMSAIELLAVAAGDPGDPAAPRGGPTSNEDEDADLGPVAITIEAAGTGADGAVAEPLATDDWVAALLDGLPDRHLTESAEPAGFVGELRHYQRRGLTWLRLLADLGVGGCLADDMGLGKTATTLAHLSDRTGPHLVVCPLSVVHNWEAEAARFVPGLSVRVHHGADRDIPTLEGPEHLVVVTTYGLLARDASLASTAWGTVVFDEAQTVKNPATKAARAARALHADQRLALTGTPVENRLDELWAVMDLVNPGSLGSRQRFRERVAMPIERHHDEEVAAALRARIGPFILRRTKADRRLLPELPDKLEQIAFATLTREQAVLYDEVVASLLRDADQLEGMQRRGRVLAALTRLKQICNHPAHALADQGRLHGRSGKLARFDELVDELLDADQRALVFTQFREMGDLLQRHLRERLHLDVAFLHGGVARTRRARMVDAFQDGSGSPLLLVSLKAGGTGLNLTAASRVIHYDRWWNPAVEDQATDRAWRLGQRRAVLVHKLVCQGTVEERIGEIIDDKRRLADAVVGTGETWLSELSTDQLADLVRLHPDGRGR